MNRWHKTVERAKAAIQNSSNEASEKLKNVQANILIKTSYCEKDFSDRLESGKADLVIASKLYDTVTKIRSKIAKKNVEFGISDLMAKKEMADLKEAMYKKFSTNSGISFAAFQSIDQSITNSYTNEYELDILGTETADFKRLAKEAKMESENCVDAIAVANSKEVAIEIEEDVAKYLNLI